MALGCRSGCDCRCGQSVLFGSTNPVSRSRYSRSGGDRCLPGPATAKGQAFFSLAKEARVEIRKVVWPSRQETTQTTLIVVAVVLVMALLLWGLDSLLGWLVSMIVG